MILKDCRRLEINTKVYGRVRKVTTLKPSERPATSWLALFSEGTARDMLPGREEDREGDKEGDMEEDREEDSWYWENGAMTVERDRDVDIE